MFQRAAASTCESGPGAARQDGRKPAPFALELAMAEGVDAAVERPKAPRPKPLLDPGGPYAGAENLRAADNAVLASGNGRQTPIRRGLVAFSFHLKG